MATKIEEQPAHQLAEQKIPKGNENKDSVATAQKNLSAIDLHESAFKLYTFYSNGKRDPVEIIEYRETYEKGNYEKVLLSPHYGRLFDRLKSGKIDLFHT